MPICLSAPWSTESRTAALTSGSMGTRCVTTIPVSTNSWSLQERSGTASASNCPSITPCASSRFEAKWK